MSAIVKLCSGSPAHHDPRVQEKEPSCPPPKERTLDLSFPSLRRLFQRGTDPTVSSEKEAPKLQQHIQVLRTENGTLRADKEALEVRLTEAHKETARKVIEIAELEKSLKEAREAITPRGVESMIRKNLPSEDPFENLLRSISEQNRGLSGALADAERDSSFQQRQIEELNRACQGLNEQLEALHAQYSSTTLTLQQNSIFQDNVLRVLASVLKEKEGVIRANRELQAKLERLAQMIKEKATLGSAPQEAAVVPSAPPQTPQLNEPPGQKLLYPALNQR